MASRGGRCSGKAPADGGNGSSRRSRSGRVPVTVDGVALAASLASQERFQKTVEEFLASSVREAEALHRAIDRQDGVIASLRQQVAELSRQEKGPVAPGEDDKPL